MVKQMRGQYRVKNEGLLRLFKQASDLVEAFDDVKFQHVRREQNKTRRFALQRGARRREQS